MAEALLQNQTLLAAVIAELPLALLACDVTGQVTHYNCAAVELFGIPPETAAAQARSVYPVTSQVYQLDGTTPVPPEDRPLACALRGEEISDVELIVVTPQGIARKALSSARRLVGPAGQALGAVVVVQDITERRLAEQELEQVHKQLLVASRQAGMAEVATNVLHNVGNVLNSVNISSGLIAETVRSSKASGLLKLGALLAEPDFAIALAGHPKGHAVPAYVARLAGALHDEQEKMAKEAEGMQRSINHIKAIVGMQQAKAKGGSEMLELLSLRAVAEDVVRMAGVSSESSSIKVVYDFEDVALTLIDRHKVYQILLNLVNNARHAVQDGRPGEGRITLRLRQETGGALKLEVQDTGCGIRSEDMKKIFNYGFTTRREGHGFGLHGSACAALEMGGSLTCHSDGPGLGAVFSLTLPPRPHRLAA